MKRTAILSDSQKQAISKLERLRVGALFMEPGTGKTLTALKLIDGSETDFALFLVPFQTKTNLLNELNKWEFDKPYRIVGIESISASDNIYMDVLNELNMKEKPFCIVDESLKIKNRDAKRTQRIIEIGKKCYYRLILNGTPMSKNVLDIWSQIQFLSPKILKMTYSQFKNTFVEYVEFKVRHRRKEQIKSFRNMEYLYSLIKPYVFESKLDLMVTQNYIEVPYDIEDKSQYMIARQSFLNSFDHIDSDIEFLAHAQKMQQSYAIDKNKLDTLKQLLEKTDGKALIFCKFIASANEINKIKRDDDMVLTYGKGALGLNLQAFKTAIFFDKTWDYAQLEQAKRRIYRTGQTSNVTFYMMTGDVGLENMMNQSIEKKISILDMFKSASKEEIESEF